MSGEGYESIALSLSICKIVKQLYFIKKHFSYANLQTVGVHSKNLKLKTGIKSLCVQKGT
jgi:hypothetical protein